MAGASSSQAGSPTLRTPPSHSQNPRRAPLPVKYVLVQVPVLSLSPLLHWLSRDREGTKASPLLDFDFLPDALHKGSRVRTFRKYSDYSHFTGEGKETPERDRTATTEPVNGGGRCGYGTDAPPPAPCRGCALSYKLKPPLRAQAVLQPHEELHPILMNPPRSLL